MPTRTYQIFWNPVDREPPGGITVTADIPSGWTEELDPGGSPTFTVPGMGAVSTPTIAALAAQGGDDRARVEWMIEQQIGAALASARRSNVAGGTLVVATRGTGHVIARLFIATRAPGVVVAGTLLAPADAAKLPEIERVLATVRVA